MSCDTKKAFVLSVVEENILSLSSILSTLRDIYPKKITKTLITLLCVLSSKTISIILSSPTIFQEFQRHILFKIPTLLSWEWLGLNSVFLLNVDYIGLLFKTFLTFFYVCVCIYWQCECCYILCMSVDHWSQRDYQRLGNGVINVC